MEVDAQEGEKKRKKKKKASADSEDQVETTNAPTTPSKNGREKEKVDYEVRVQAVSEFAKPLADKKLTKKTLKAVKEASKQKAVKRGVKEVVKALRKGQKGFVIIAGDISPIDVITHIPVLCEDNDVPYIYLPSKEDLGHAGSTRRPTSCIMIMEKAGAANSDMSESYKELFDELKRLNEKLISTV
ncbi:50S ribosomal protein L30e-like protein [Cladochytrium replicatum]|nr:50S ribosomal protein L30e-like protein [Cladochytrium replicatum]